MKKIKISSRSTKIAISISVALLIIVVIALMLTGGSGEEDTGFIDGLFGGGEGLTENGTGGGPNNGQTAPQGGRASLYQLVADPVAAATVNQIGDKVLFYRRDVGHLYEIGIDGGEQTRLSNITIPSVIDATWSLNKERSIITFINNGALGYFSVKNVGTTTEGILLPDNAFSATLSPGGNKIAYAIPAGDGASIVIASPIGENQKNIFYSGLFDVEIDWVTDSSLYLKTKPSSFIPGMTWILSDSGATRVLHSQKSGTVHLFSPDGEKYLYSESPLGGRSISLNVASTDGNTDEYSFAIDTIAEKCVWANKDSDVIYCAFPRNSDGLTLPDSWWSGEVSFDDNFWKINTVTGETVMIWDKNDFDAVKLFLSTDDSVLFFVNKKDSTLWGLRIE